MAPVTGTATGAYRLHEVAFGDALGVVHRATNEQTGQPALVRLLLPLAHDEAAMRRFRIELPPIAAIDHPGIVPVEAWGEGDGTPYVATPLVAAQRMSALLARGQRPDRRTSMRLLRDIAAALDHAHRAGVLHGSVGADTVLIAPDGSPRLIDLGLALVTSTAGHGGGTTADVRALAALARELLAGAPPVAPLLPTADAVLQRDWPSCGAMVEALQTAMSGRPMGATAVSVGIGATRPANRARLVRWVAAAAAVVLALTVLVSFGIHVLRPAPTLALSPASAHAGDTVTLTGANLPPGQPGTIVIAGLPVAAAAFAADSGGRFSVQVTIPQDLSGDRTIQACWGGSCPVRQVLHVIAAPSPPPPAAPARAAAPASPAPTPAARGDALSPSISLGRETVRRGRTVRVQGRGFDPNRQYQVALDEGGRHWVLQPPASPDGSGAFAATVQVPDDAQRGLATVTACVSPPGPCATQPVVVVG
jgi:hypothetical protein